ncbi:MAG: phosphoesterase [Deltaproteobacteria bacterium]|jgi:nanoRNase/pAp phosphatase (c-di-AMP/oligoRNAs hydrolase)|nr:phosphoesterase [Deltaproteobacteria bacterium]
MVQTRKHTVRIDHLFSVFVKDDFCCVLIVADPDAMASALAVKRLIAHRVAGVTIAAVNDITRPDNLAMIRYLRIPIVSWKEEMLPAFHKYILVDGQPHHCPAFRDVPFAAVIDHHPLVPEHPVQAAYVDVRPGFGATSTLLTRYLQHARIRPSIRLATALQYGIHTDTAAFARAGDEADLRAFQFLSKHADHGLLRRILHSEYLIQWLPMFSRAFASLKPCGTGYYAHAGQVANPDILVAIADFFARIHGLAWVAVCGVYEDMAVVIFRGDGIRDIGRFAAERFQALGSAGGHRRLARAEFPLVRIPKGVSAQTFVWKRLL